MKQKEFRREVRYEEFDEEIKELFRMFIYGGIVACILNLVITSFVFKDTHPEYLFYFSVLPAVGILILSGAIYIVVKFVCREVVYVEIKR